jgi:hypothetical protein
MYYEEEIKALNQSRLKYLIVGGLAVNLYGVHRLTRDLDLMIDISEENLNKFAEIMKKLGYASKITLEKAKNLVALCFHHTKDEFKQIDIFLKNPIDFKKAYRRRKVIKVKNVPFSCASLQDIIQMKEKAGRDRDWIDIGALRKITKS